MTEKLPAKMAILAWNPGTDQVAVVPWPDKKNLCKGYACTALACWEDFRRRPQIEVLALCFIEAMQLIVGDGCDAVAVHNAMCGIKEYDAALAEDVPRP